MSEYGEFVARRVLNEGIRIDVADDLILVSSEFLAAPHTSEVVIDGDLISFLGSNRTVRYRLEGFDGQNRIARKVEP